LLNNLLVNQVSVKAYPLEDNGSDRGDRIFNVTTYVYVFLDSFYLQADIKLIKRG